MKNQKASEVSKIASALAKANSRGSASVYAGALVSPKDAGPIVFPGVTPSRASAALFPLVVEVSGPEEFGVIVTPDISQPLRIATGALLPESTSAITGAFMATGGVLTTNISHLKNEGPALAHSETVAGRPGIPMTSAAASTWALQLAVVEGTAKEMIYTWDAYDGVLGTWVTLDTSQALSLGGFYSGSAKAWSTDYTHFGFTITGGLGVQHVSYVLKRTTGSATVGPAGAKTSLTTHVPDWSTIINASERASIVAADCLVTFEGSTLNNGGSIAACNADDELEIKGSFYETVAARPHDMYRGRLSSEGETEGGAHWHYVPDDPIQLILQDRRSFAAEMRQQPFGYIGVIGKHAGEVVRVECHFLVNFYSTDPSFAMTIQPAFRDFSSLLFALRTEVPLVSSNDAHLKKLAKLFHNGARKVADFGNSSLRFIGDNEQNIARALALLA
mgnify:CR=1 FL=1